MTQQDNAATGFGEFPSQALPRLVFVVPQELPLAEVAERLLRRWRRDWHQRPPAWILVEEGRHANLVEMLRRRLAKTSPLPSPPNVDGLFRDATLAALDGGATLVTGGQDLSDAGLQATLFVNVKPSLRLLHNPEVQGPILCLSRSSGPERNRFLLEQMESPVRLHRFQTQRTES